ncbi:MAG: lipoprotein-releasing ABC transporter ATP-binding protein LolD [Pseudomonadota bacterium]
MNDAVVLACQQLKKSYNQGPEPVEVLNNINLQINTGDRVAIIGSSGSGKSTLLNLLGGLDTPSGGDVQVGGRSLASLNANQRGLLRNQCLGFVYQFHHLLGEFTALENVAMPLLIARLGVKQAKQRAQQVLTRVGLGQRLQHKPSELSGGERQRVAIARAIVTKPACVLLDEPTGNLDQETAAAIQSLLWDLNRDYRISFLIVTHDRQLAYSMDRVLELSQGELTVAAPEQ